MKQFQQPDPLVELHQRRDRRVREPAIGPRRKRPQFVKGEAPGREQPDDAGGEFRIRQTGEIAQSVAADRRQPFRNVKSAILGETGEQHLVERAESGRRPGIACAQIAHAANVIPRRCRRNRVYPPGLMVRNAR